MVWRSSIVLQFETKAHKYSQGMIGQGTFRGFPLQVGTSPRNASKNKITFVCRNCLISHRSGGRFERVVLLPRLNLQLKGLLSQRLVVDLFRIKKTIFPQVCRYLLFTILYLFHPVDETGGWVDGEVTILVAWQKKNRYQKFDSISRLNHGIFTFKYRVVKGSIYPFVLQVSKKIFEFNFVKFVKWKVSHLVEGVHRRREDDLLLDLLALQGKKIGKKINLSRLFFWENERLFNLGKSLQSRESLSHP